MRITLLSLPSGQQIMGKIIDEDDDTLTLDGPITISIANPLSTETAILTSRYMPLAKDWVVTFQKINITSFCFVDESLIEHYSDMVQHYKNRPYNYSSTRGESSNQSEDEVDQSSTNNDISSIINKKYLH